MKNQPSLSDVPQRSENRKQGNSELRTQEHYFFSCRNNFTVVLVGLSYFSQINFEARHVRRNALGIGFHDGSIGVAVCHKPNTNLESCSGNIFSPKTLFNRKQYRLATKNITSRVQNYHFG